jgi:hypothetical protein
MAKVSWPDRKRIKRTLRDSFDPSAVFPVRTAVLATGGDPMCPPEVDFLALNIQCELLPYFDRAEFVAFCRWARGESIIDLANEYNVSRFDLYRAIHRMLDTTIRRMKRGTAEGILSVYWEMHKQDDYVIVESKE